MTESELLSAYFEALAAINGNFEYWLSVTIGLLVAFHFAGSEISGFLKRFVIFLYSITAIIFLLRIFNTGRTMMSIVDLLNAANTQVIVQPIGAWVIGPLYVVVMLAGSTASIFYANHRSINTEISKSSEY